MILPIVAYGHSQLRTRCETVPPDYPSLQQLITNMWQTLYGANGCGLAAPQVNVPLRLFLVESQSTFNLLSPEEQTTLFPEGTGIRETFINPEITDRSAETWEEEEGCLSIPGLRASVTRPWSITIRYEDAAGTQHTRSFAGLTARMIQHEYDHLEGRLYLDYLAPIKRKLMARKLEYIRTGRFRAPYPMK
ncbi:peptide deformylase [Chitinophaga sp. HK235]|uniref:peptide deformylase n=1 Tax=Chitinophaga sp. HK235 TaxID=2952571 RepID=UPI001BAD1A75|nr:peptide deformylase [Chitinophaga sp. HK235]